MGTLPPRWGLLGTGDFNGDGKVDLLYRDETTGQQQVYLTSGDGLSMAAKSWLDQPVLAASGWRFFTCADFNGDGRDDLLWNRASDGANMVWLLGPDGFSVTTKQVIGKNWPKWTLLGAGDFNHDGRADLLYRDAVTGRQQLYLTSSDGLTMASKKSFGSVLADYSGWQFHSVADFNGDGAADILWHNPGTGANLVWFTNPLGPSLASAKWLGQIATSWTLIDTGDYNGDGNSDLLYRDEATGQQLVYLTSGDGQSMATKKWLGPKIAPASGWSYATGKVLPVPGFEVYITSPAPAATLGQPFALVEGLLINAAPEVGVTINGVPAQVVGNTFFVNNLPLHEGENTLTAVATDAAGVIVEKSITVTANTVGKEWLELLLNPDSGVTFNGVDARPFTTTLRVDPHLDNPMAGYQLTWEYSGTATNPLLSVTTSSPDGLEHQLSSTIPGVYTIKYTLTDSTAVKHEGSIKVNVLDSDGLDGILRGKWEGMKGRLIARDVEGALKYFREPARDNYREQFNILSANLPRMVAEMQEIELICVEGHRAKYRINRNQVIDGIPETITYFIYFVIDGSGLWTIEQF